jgi:hypothetical protein
MQARDDPYGSLVVSRSFRRSRRPTAVLTVVGLAILMTLAGASGARAIHRGFDAPIRSYTFMVSLRLADTPDDPR